MESYNTQYELPEQRNTALAMRLDTSSILEDIEMFLRGTKIVIITNKETGEITPQQIPIFNDIEHSQRANPLGIQSILSFIRCVINTAVVQGNYTEARLEDYLCQLHIDFTTDLVINRVRWGINKSDLDFIIDTIMAIIEPFMTRLLENKERESYAETVRHFETTSPNQENKKGLLRGWST